MKNENETTADQDTASSEASSTEAPAQPRKIVLGKRVLRHFQLKSNLKTGGITDDCTSQASNHCTLRSMG